MPIHLAHGTLCELSETLGPRARVDRVVSSPRGDRTRSRHSTPSTAITTGPRVTRSLPRCRPSLPPPLTSRARAVLLALCLCFSSPPCCPDGAGGTANARAVGAVGLQPGDGIHVPQVENPFKVLPARGVDCPPEGDVPRRLDVGIAKVKRADRHGLCMASVVSERNAWI